MTSFLDDKNKKRGIVMSLMVIPIAVVAWTVIWQLGTIASIVPLFISFGSVLLYKIGSKKEVTKDVLVPIIAIIVIGTFIAFIAAMLFDGWFSLARYMGPYFSTNDIWDEVFRRLSNRDVLGFYRREVYLAVVSTAVGIGVIVYRVSKLGVRPAK